MPILTDPAGRAGRILAAPPDGGAGWDGLDVLVLSPTPTYPTDAGNRRRIFFINQALQQQGARITFVHYPAEHGWHRRAPTDHILAMAGQWHASHTVPTTRSLHDPAIGEDHTIDEWWDRAIGDMLLWLFRTNRFHVFIVNYAWLSKAFEFCPPEVLKILDTHDRFSGRRDLLGRLGIAPEFFHTTLDQERIALDRADVVWAIKAEEAVFFRTVTRRLVVEMPHIEPLAGFSAAPRLSGRVLRFGFAGAANGINRANLWTFLAAAEKYIRRTLLPCEVVIAGGICDLLPEMRLSWVRQLGRLDDMATFYRSVDVVLAPVGLSTGLKIKVGEALCRGKAVVALAHAFEGYRAAHPFHTLDSIDDMLRACRRIVNEPGLIEELEQASLRSVRQAQQDVASGLRDSISQRWWLDRGICIVVEAADVFPGSVVVDHVRETAQCLGRFAPVIVFLHGGDHLPDISALRALAAAGTLVTTPELQAALGPERVAWLDIGLLRVRRLRDLLRDPHDAFWFASCPGTWTTPPKPRAGRAFVACDAVLQSTDPAELPAFLQRLRASFAEVVVFSRRVVPAAIHPDLASRSHRVPLLWHGERSLILPLLHAGRDLSVLVLAADPADPLLALVVALVLSLSPRPVRVVLPDRLLPEEGVTALEETLAGGKKHRERVRVVPASRCFSPGGASLAFAVATDPALEALREILDYGGVPLADLCAGRGRPVYGQWTEPTGATGLFESVRLVEQLLTEPGAAGQLRTRRCAARDRINDAGWVWIEAEFRAVMAAQERSG